MTVIRKDMPEVENDENQRGMGVSSEAHYSDAGGLTQFGAHVVSLQPGARSSDRHWHEAEDEFLYVLDGEATVVEEDGPHVLGPGDAACWPAGAANAHHVLNRSDAPCSFIVVGTRAVRDVQRYPDLGRTTYVDGKDWRVMDDRSGKVLRQGRDD
jgi:uncharacterized cupin superfamily protein